MTTKMVAVVAVAVDMMNMSMDTHMAHQVAVDVVEAAAVTSIVRQSPYIVWMIKVEMIK